MAPLSLIISAAFLSICGVQASHKHKVTVFQWNGEQCQGHIKGKPFHLEINQCKEIDAMSLKFAPDPKAKHNEWIDAINRGEGLCYITAYPNGKCAEAPRHVEHVNHGWPAPKNIDLPKNIGHCVSVHGGIRSVKFWCKPKIGTEQKIVTEDFTYTSWNVINGTATPVDTSTEAVVTGDSLTISPRFEATAAPQAGNIIQPRAEPHDEPQEPTKHEQVAKNVWYTHPWVKVALCFECRLTEKDDSDKFQCEASENTQLSCEWPAPDGSTATKTSILSQPIEVVTHYSINTALVTPGSNVSSVTPDQKRPQPHAEFLEKRKQKLLVSLTNPFIHGSRTCAKAKWSNEGKRNQKIILKGPANCHDKSNENIDPPINHTSWVSHTFPPTTVTTSAVSTETASDETIKTVTSTTTVSVTTTVSAHGRFPSTTTIGGVVYKLWPPIHDEE